MRIRISYMAVLLMIFIGFAVGPVPSLAADGRFLGREEIILYGLGLKVEPEHQFVPKDIATIVSTYMQVPEMPPGEIPPLPPDAVVTATLRGPSFTLPIELTVQANTPFNIPPLHIPGTHSLENIRVVSNGEVLFYGTPEGVTIEVIDQLLVTEVTARPLTADEIREKGIVFDKENFQAYNFTAAFAIEPGKEIKIDFPVLLPTLAAVQDVDVAQVGIPQLAVPQLPNLSTIIPDTLKMAQTQVPNLQVQGFTLKIEETEAQGFSVPPIPGVIVIPGDIGFLNQYFSVMLMVGNVAPAGSNLTVKDLRAEIVLPPGNDTVVGSNDDPLRMAMTEQGEAPRIQPVTKPGPDGKLGTADDENFVAPGESGNAEFLVEGRREGTHLVEMEITGTLVGLPIGPVTIRGRAAGAVLVRNPSFTLTFTHPDIVNAGEEYTLDITVTNTSESPANFVSVNLYPRNISGATLVSEETQEVESIQPGDSATVSYTLISKVTGKVFAATLDSDEKITGRFQLKTSVGELGIPLSPDSLVLPKEANSLPRSLRDAAIGLLGKAYAVATAPASALPKDVTRFSKKIVWDRAIETAEAGLRHTMNKPSHLLSVLGSDEPLSDTAKQLMMDFMGSNYTRLTEVYPKENEQKIAESDFPGFDELRRRSIRGDVFAGVVASILTEELSASGLSAFHHDFAEKVSYRPEHLSVAINSLGGPLPFNLSIVDSNGRKLGGMGLTEEKTPREKVIKEIPFSDYLTLKDNTGAAAGQMAIISVPQPGNYTIRLDKVAGIPDDAAFSLSIVVPKAGGGLRQIVYQDITGAELPAVQFESGDPVTLSIETYFDGIPGQGVTVLPETDQPVIDPPPSVISVVQQAEADKIANDCGTWRFGRVVAVLFSEEVTAVSVQDKLKRQEITHYALEENEVVGVALQPGRRIAFLALRDPVGPFIERSISLSEISDSRGNIMASWTEPIQTTIEDSAGVVSGRIMQADGTPVDGADVRLFTGIYGGAECEFMWYGVSSKHAGPGAEYAWDYVLRNDGSRIVAIEPETETFRDLRFNIGRHGQRLNVDVIFLGRGTLEGRAIAEDGITPLEGADLRVTSLTDQSQYGIKTDREGRFVIPGIPVGNILIEAVHVASNSKITQSDHISDAGEIVERDLILLTEHTRKITIKYGKVSGHVLRSDGATPVSDVPVIVYYKSGSQEGVNCPLGGECPLAIQNTDANGAFVFNEVVAGGLRVYTFDQARLQEGEAGIILSVDGEESVNILLSGGFGTVRGVVLDADGNPVEGATVGGGLSLTTTNAQGEFILSDVPVGNRGIVAVSEAIGSSGSANINLIAEGEEVNATVVLSGVGSVYGTIYESDGVTTVPNLEVYLWRFADGGSIQVVATAVTDSGGNYRMDKVPVSASGDYNLSSFLSDLSDGNVTRVAVRFNNQKVRANVTFKGGGGRVRGVIYDDDGVTPLKARVSVSGLRVRAAAGGGVRIGLGFEHVQHMRIVDNNFTTGEFSFDNLFVGPFVITAAGPFSPDLVTFSGEIPSAGATVDVNIRLQPTSEIRGIVYQPDGFTPAGEGVKITFKSDEFRVICNGDDCQAIPQGIQEEIVVTDAEGRFWLPIVNAGKFTVRAEDEVPGRSTSGKKGKVTGMVAAGQTADVSVRLLGTAAVTARVFRSDGTTPVPGAWVDIEQTGFSLLRHTGLATDGTVTFSGGDAPYEGDFVVTARDLQNGFAGRASGRVTEDEGEVIVNVYLYDATGSVYGTVFRPDGITPVPSAEVSIFNNEGSLAFAITDGSGGYRQDYIPLGDIRVEVFEAATGRRGFNTGRIDLAGEEEPVNVIESGIGQVNGTVMASGDLSPLKGWAVRLSQTLASGKFVSLMGTTGIDGGFFFPGVSVGTFSVDVYKAGLGSSHTEGRITREGEVVDIPVVVNLIKPAYGRIEGWVYNPDGTAAANSRVCLAGCLMPLKEVTSDGDGHFAFEEVSFGRHTIEARSQVTSDSGSAPVEVAFAGETVYVSITLAGLGRITGTAYHDSGSPAGYVKVVKMPGEECGSPIEGCITFADADGRFEFINVPAGRFNIFIEDPVLHLNGAAGGILNPGGTEDVRVVLEPTAGLAGRVLFSNGNPAQGVVGELRANGRSLTLYVETGADGRFSFRAIPMGTFRLDLEDPLGPGIAGRNISVLSTDTIDLGDIVLDEAPPMVASINPVPGAVSVPLDAVIRITFSEPVQPGTVNQTNITVSRQDGTTVSGILAVGDGDTTATFTPIVSLTDESRYTVRIKGVKDRLNRVMMRDFISSFTTVDITPPSFLDVAPAPDTSGVSIDNVIRIRYSEPVNPARFTGPAIILSNASGMVAGRVDMILGNTGVVFTPNLPLSVDSRYHLIVLPATDLAGNIQTAALEYEFSTTDMTAPVIQTLIPSNNGGVIEGGVGTATADVGTAYDVSFVDFFINDVLSYTDRLAPFEMSFLAAPALGQPGDAIQVSAIATDTSGNRGNPTGTAFTILADSPPVATIVSPLTGTPAETGARVNVTVQSVDDLGVTKIGYQAVGGQPPAAATKDISPTGTSASLESAFYVPVDAVPGSVITINATAVDTRDQLSRAVPVEITVLDATAPVIGFSGLTTGEKVRPGQNVTAVVSASDLGGIASVSFRATGAAVHSESREITPSQNSVVTSFSFTVSSAAGPLDRVTLEAEAVDQAGNKTAAPKVILPVADTIPPTVTLRTESGNFEMIPGRTVTLIAEASDEVGVSRIDLTGSGAFTVSDAKGISPPLGSAQATFIIIVPSSVAAGDTLTLQAKALDISGNISQPASIALTAGSLVNVQMPASLLIQAGETQTVAIRLSEPALAGGVRVDLASEHPGRATVTASLLFSEGETEKTASVSGVAGGTTFINASIQGVVRVSMTVTVRGGIVTGTVYNPFPSPVAGVEVNINGVITTTDADGRFFVEGITGPGVTVRAYDPVTKLKGYFAGNMNAWSGFLRDVPVILVQAGSVSGTVFLPDGQTPAGEGAEVKIFNSGDLHNPLQTLFTDANSQFEFPLVSMGSYVVEASDISGNRGRSNVTVTESGQESSILVVYLGRGSVTGTVLDGGGNPVPNADVRLSSNNVFGGNYLTMTAGIDGAFRFDGVFIGSFNVWAKDNRTGLGASSGGNITAHEQVVSLTLQTAAWAVIEGYVYRSDGSTPVSGASVYARCGYSCVYYATTAETGYYRFELLPLATYTIQVWDAGTRDSAEQQVSLQTNGETRIVDFNLPGQQGTVVVTVKDANDQIVAGASANLTDSVGTIYGTTSSEGVTLFEHVRAGAFSAYAEKSGLRGSATGSLATGGIAYITVRLEPVASITGVVYGPDGQTPQAGAVVYLYGVASYTTGSDGVFTFEGLHLGTYELRVYDSNGNYRAKTTGIVLDSNGQTETRDLTLIGLGTVTGRVLMPDGSSASNMPVTVQSSTPDFGRTHYVTTNAAGYYTVERVSVGSFTISTGNINLQLLGEGSGTINAHGETVTVDIILQNNAITLPKDLYDGNIAKNDIYEDGTICTGTGSLFYGYTTYDYYTGRYGCGRKGGAALEIISGGTTYSFSGGEIATQEDQGREVVVRQEGIAGLNVTRKVYIPKEGYFARYLEVLTNPTAGPITVDLLVKHQFDNNIRVITTSSGDEQMQVVNTDTPDQWAVMDDSNTQDPFLYSNKPATAFLWDGTGSADRADNAGFTAWVDYNSPARLTAGWNQITVQPGEQVAFMHFVSQQASRDAAIASAGRLVQLPPESLSGMSLSEMSIVRNFAIPADGSSPMSPLAPLTGDVTGRIFAGDGVSTVPYTCGYYGCSPDFSVQVYLKSSNIYFSRIYRVGMDYSGAFALRSDLNNTDPYSRKGIPVDDFTLRAEVNRGTAFSSPTITGSFPPASNTINQDIVFSNTGILDGRVLRATGETETSPVSIALSASGGPPPSSGPFGKWLGDGNAKDLTGTNSGTLMNGVAFETGVTGQAFSLDGVDDFVKLPDNFFSLYESFTFDLWFKTTSGGVILGQQNADPSGTPTGWVPAVYVGTDGLLRVEMFWKGSVDPVVSQAPVNDGVFHQVTVTHDASRAMQQVYLDGVLMGSKTHYQYSYASIYKYQLGTGYTQNWPAGTGGWYSFAGLIDDVTIYKRVTENQGISASAATAADGSYRILFLPSGSYNITATKTNPLGSPLTTSAVVDMTAGRTTSLDISLPAIGTVTATVRSADSAPVYNSKVTLQRTGFSRTARTDTSGQYTFTEVPAADYTLTVSEPVTNIQVSATVTVMEGETTTKDFQFLRSGKIAGMARFADGVTQFSGSYPYEIEILDGETGARLMTVYPACASYYYGYCQTYSASYDTGYFASNAATLVERLTWNYPGSEGWRTVTMEQTVPGFAGSAQSVTQNFNLPVNQGDIRARVYQSTGALLTGASVTIEARDPVDNTLLKYCSTSIGECTISNVVAGAEGIRVRAVYDTNTAEQTIYMTSSNTTQDVSFTFSIFGGRIRGSVYYADGITRPYYTYPAIEVLDGATRALIKTTSANWDGSYDTGFFTSGATSFIIKVSWQYSIYAGTETVSTEQTVSGFSPTNDLIIQNLQLPVNRGNIQARVLTATGTPLTSESIPVEFRDPLDDTLLYMCYTQADYYYYGYLYPGTGACTVYSAIVGTNGIKVRAVYGSYTAETIVTLTATDTTVNADLTLQIVLGSVSGQVLAGDGVSAVSGVLIEAVRAADGTVLKTGYTGYGGAYTLTNIAVPSTEDVIIRASFDGIGGIIIMKEQTVNFASSESVTGVDFVFPLSIVMGNVFAGDGVTGVDYAIVEVIRTSDWYLVETTQTASNGSYMTDPFYSGAGDVIVQVRWPDDCGGECSSSIPTVYAEQTVTLADTGETRQVDIIMPVSVVKGTVYKYDGVTPVDWPSVFATQTDWGGNTVTYYSRTYGGGVYDILGMDVGIGSFTVTAQDGNTGLQGTAGGMITDISQPAIVDVMLGPSGTVTGQVLDDGVPVAWDARVTLRIDAIGFERSVYTDQDGVYLFEDVPVGDFTLTAVDYRSWPYRYSEPVIGNISSHGETVTTYIVIPPLGTVMGTVYGADGNTPAAVADVRISHPASGWSDWTSSDSNGWYYYSGVVPGDIIVDAYSGNWVGSSGGSLTSGSELTVDVVLSGISLGTYNLDGADGFRYDVQRGGYLSDGGTADRRFSDAYDGAYYLYVNGGQMTWNSAIPEDSDRELAIGPQTMSGLQVTRKVYVPADGGFARYVEIIHNPGPDTTVNVQVSGNLGSDSGTRISTFPGDTGNTYAVTYESGRGDPSLAHVFGGPGASVNVSYVQFVSGLDNINYRWDSVPFASGETRCFMHFAVQREPNDEAGAQAQAEALVNLTDSDALSGMSADEKACVVNFAITP